MDTHLKTSGFSASAIDPCLYYRIRKEDYTIIALIVDDMIVATNTKVGDILEIMERRFKMKNLGEVKWCLGMKVSRDRDNNYVYLSQDTYIGKVMRAFKMDDPKVKGADTPGSTSKRMSKADCSEVGTKEKWPYRAIVGSLIYGCITRPDIQHMVGVLSRFCSRPGLPHWEGAKRVLRYLKSTINLRIRLGGKVPIFYGYADADWCGENATTMDECRSTSGGIVYLGDGPIWWLSKVQRVTALSTTEAEYVATGVTTMGYADQETKIAGNDTFDMKTIVAKQDQYAKTLTVTHTICSLLGLRAMLKEIGCPQKPTIIFTDSKGNFDSIKNPINTKLRHVNMRYHRVRQAVRDDQIKVMHLGTKDMIADIFTKCMTIKEFTRLRELSLGFGVKPGLPMELKERLGYN